MSRSSQRKSDDMVSRRTPYTVTTASVESLLEADSRVPALEAWISPAAQFRSPWTLPLPVGQGSFFAVLSGRCRLVRCNAATGGDAEWPSPLNPGDLVIIREGGWMLCDLEAAPANFLVKTVITTSRDRTCTPAGTRETRLLCGGFRIPVEQSRSVTSDLPPVVHVTGEHGKLLPWAEHLLQLLQEEAARGPARAQLLIDRLFSVLLAKALRENSPLAGRRELGHQQQREDEEVQDALARIHARPDFPWTVARLADEVGLSRSGFAARFSQRVGRPPWEYLRDLRMELASQLLREGGHGLKEIAVRTGYKTASAISTAFKRWAGVSPLEYRRAPITSRQPSAHEASSQ